MTGSNTCRSSSRASPSMAVLFAVFSVALVGVHGFQMMTSVPTNFACKSSLRSSAIRVVPNNNVQLPEPWRRHASSVRTFMSSDVAEANETAIDAAVLKRLDDEMKNAAERRKKLEEKLAQMQSKLEEEDAKIQDIASKKKQYLDGDKLGVIPRERTFSETAVRSAVKAMLWRVIAGLVTLATAFRFSRSLSTAFSIVGSDFFSKSFTMFLGERLMNKSSAGRTKGADNVGRSLAKALVWRLFAITNTLFMSLFIAKNLSVASKIAGADAIIKTTLMFLYERVWAKVEWGKEYAIEFSI